MLYLQNEDELIIKTLVVFGAHCNARNDFKQTPLDMAIENRVSPMCLHFVYTHVTRVNTHLQLTPPSIHAHHRKTMSFPYWYQSGVSKAVW